MLDGNSAALRAHEIEQERLEKKVEDLQPWINDRAFEILTLRYASGGDAAIEACGGAEWSELDYFTIAGILRCIRDSESFEVKEVHYANIGRLVEKRIYEYLIDDATEEATQEAIEEFK